MSQIEESWMPIETAPKDGTHILMWRNGLISEAWWHIDILGKYVWGGNGWSFPEWDQPQAWMNKPAPPFFLTRRAADASPQSPLKNES